MLILTSGIWLAFLLELSVQGSHDGYLPVGILSTLVWNILWKIHPTSIQVEAMQFQSLISLASIINEKYK